jgi:hypothetical protein
MVARAEWAVTPQPLVCEAVTVAWAEQAAHWPATVALVEKVERAGMEPMGRTIVTRRTATLAVTADGGARAALREDLVFKESVAMRGQPVMVVMVVQASRAWMVPTVQRLARLGATALTALLEGSVVKAAGVVKAARAQ